MSHPRSFSSICEAVGETPLVKLGPSLPETSCEVFAKLEYLNPMGSIKDRIARFMIDRAMEDGTLTAGGTVLEASSGNTAMGLALMAIQRGLCCKMVVRRQTSKEKLDCLRALGVELILVDGDLPPEHPDSYNQKARRLAREHPDWFFPDQHNNRANNEAHYGSTGPEIWDQMEGNIDYLVAGIGTGGTISGVGRYLKEQDPNIKIVAVDVEGSVFTEHFRNGRLIEPHRYLLEGLGDEEIIDCPEFEVIDEMYQVSDRDAFAATRRLARTEAVLAGGSSGAAMWGVLQLLTELDTPSRVVTIFPDSGMRYLSTIYNDDWLRQQNLL